MVRFETGPAMFALMMSGAIIGLALNWTVAGTAGIGAVVGWCAGGLLDGYIQQKTEEARGKEALQEKQESIQKNLHFDGGIFQRLDRIEKKVDEFKEAEEDE